MSLKQAFFESPGNSTSVKPVQRRLLIPLTIILLLLLGGFSVVLIKTQKENLNQSTRKALQIAVDRLATLQNEQTKAITALEEIILSDKGLHDALKTLNRQQLLEDYASMFALLREKHGITHFYFHGPDRVNLLRVHKPAKNGDLIYRHTALEAERTGQTSAGIELGPLGTFTLRVVRPVFDNDAIIGYLELGKEIEDILASIHDENSVELAVTIRKKALDKTAWESGMKMLGRKSNWSRYADEVLIYSSFEQFPFECDAFIAEGQHRHDDVANETLINDEAWRVVLSPLADVSGAEVGHLIILMDISETNAARVRIVTLVIASALTLLSGLFGFLYFVLRGTDRGIHSQQAQLVASEEQHRILAESMKDVIVQLTPDGKLLYVSPAIKEFGGYDSESAIGNDMSQYFEREADYLNAVELLVNVSKTEQSGVFEFLFKPKNKKPFPVEQTYNPILKDNKVTSIQLVLRDISDRKQVEKELRQTNKHLEQQTAFSNTLAAEAEMANSAKSEFLANM
ncbi:MAG: PAS domain S-box protein, partial [Desulfobacterales bacterium]|nr:PAS domain S-box protein [Desulfobacterales bacterium]